MQTCLSARVREEGAAQDGSLAVSECSSLQLAARGGECPDCLSNRFKRFGLIHQKRSSFAFENSKLFREFAAFGGGLYSKFESLNLRIFEFLSSDFSFDDF